MKNVALGVKVLSYYSHLRGPHRGSSVKAYSQIPFDIIIVYVDDISDNFIL